MTLVTSLTLMERDTLELVSDYLDDIEGNHHIIPIEYGTNHAMQLSEYRQLIVSRLQHAFKDQKVDIVYIAHTFVHTKPLVH